MKNIIGKMKATALKQRIVTGGVATVVLIGCIVGGVYPFNSKFIIF